MSISNAARARMGGLARSAQYDGRDVTAKATKRFRERFLAQVDPDNVLTSAERERRADAAFRLHMARLAMRSVHIRQAKAKRRAGAETLERPAQRPAPRKERSAAASASVALEEARSSGLDSEE